MENIGKLFEITKNLMDTQLTLYGYTVTEGLLLLIFVILLLDFFLNLIRRWF